jgi:hypothetical protein
MSTKAVSKALVTLQMVGMNVGQQIIAGLRLSALGRREAVCSPIWKLVKVT